MSGHYSILNNELGASSSTHPRSYFLNPTEAKASAAAAAKQLNTDKSHGPGWMGWHGDSKFPGSRNKCFNCLKCPFTSPSRTANCPLTDAPGNAIQVKNKNTNKQPKIKHNYWQQSRRPHTQAAAPKPRATWRQPKISDLAWKCTGKKETLKPTLAKINNKLVTF